MELKQNYYISPCKLFGLLIVPYGIETSVQRENTGNYTLLIVPYGIETKNYIKKGGYRCSFNRTLWN